MTGNEYQENEKVDKYRAVDSFGINYLYSLVICQIGGEDHGIS